MIASTANDRDQPTGSQGTILAVAEELMSKHGYAGTSISMISKRAGLPTSSIYWHFESKQRLLEEVLEQAISRLLASLPDPDLLAGDAEERVEAYLLGCFAQPGSERGAAFRVLTMAGLQRGLRGTAAPAAARRVRRQVEIGWKRLFSRLGQGRSDPEADAAAAELARFAMAACDGMSFAAQVDPDAEPAQLARLATVAITALAGDLLGRRNAA